MIKKISSSLSSFKEIEFHDGLNLLIAKKESGATDRQTRNRAGKSSLIEIIHFLFGADADKNLCLEPKPLLINLSGLSLIFKVKSLRLAGRVNSNQK